MIPAPVVWLFAFLALLGILREYLNYRQRVSSNIFSHQDQMILFWLCVLMAVVLSSSLSTLAAIDSGLNLAILLFILFLSAIVVPGIVAIVRGYLRPGAMHYQPQLVKYWPAWIITDRQIVKDQSFTLRFALVESFFDLNLASIRKDTTNDKTEQEVLTSQDFAKPMRRHQEQAATASGQFTIDNPVIKVECEAPGFEPAKREIKTDIRELNNNTLTFTLLPKSVGEREVVFRLKEVVQQFKIRRKRKENRALNPKRSKSFSTKSNCGTVSIVTNIFPITYRAIEVIAKNSA